MDKKQHAVYNINEDLASLRRNRLYTKQCEEGAEHYMFDVNDYPMKEPSLTPQNYALTELQSKEYAVTVAKLRSIIIDRAREMFGPGIDEE